MGLTLFYLSVIIKYLVQNGNYIGKEIIMESQINGSIITSSGNTVLAREPSYKTKQF
jgi:hypothetical protein